MAASSEPTGPSITRRAAQVIVVGSVMFTFISFWKTAAVVLCDLASTAYYIGGIAEQAIGPAAPWFILSVMVFSYAVRNVYIESCSMFVRGGVYRVVKEAMGGFMGKLSVSALMFDYILTGPISAVSAGQYLFGWIVEALHFCGMPDLGKDTEADITKWGAVLFAVLVTLYFFWQNKKGIHESADKAFKIMIATTIMAALILGWCGLTLAVQGRAPVKEEDYKRLSTMSSEERNQIQRNSVPFTPTFEPKKLPKSDETQDPLGFISKTGLGESLRNHQYSWLSIIGLIGVTVAFGHSILAMSGEETLAQVYREVEAPKLLNFRKAGFVVFVYSLGLTSAISFLAVLLIPNDVRMENYADNLISGLAMHVYGPTVAKLVLNAIVVLIGALILSGAVNTAIIGANGVLNRVAEDGVLPDWLLRPHPRYGTSYRVLYLILFLKLFTIIASRGDVILLGEAYAFGVVWSFVFKALSMVVLRFKDKSHRDYRVPFNIKLGRIELPLGLISIFLVLAGAAFMNLLTKEIATVSGMIFTVLFLIAFTVSEHFHSKTKPRIITTEHGHIPYHLEQFTVETRSEEALSRETLGLAPKPYLKLVAIRSTQNLFMLEKALAETDPDTTNIVVMTAKVLPIGVTELQPGLDRYEQELMTAVVDRAEKAGKRVKPLIVPTNNPFNAVLQTARDMKAQEVVMGASNKYATDEQLEGIEFDWLVVNGGHVLPLTVRILGRDRDVHLDIGGGNRIPRISERRAKSVAELRAAGVGVSRVLLFHDGMQRGSDLFRAALTMLDPQVALTLATPGEPTPIVKRDEQQGDQLGRPVRLTRLDGDLADALVAAAKNYDLVVVMASDALVLNVNEVVREAHCPVFVATFPAIPTDSVAD